MTHSDIRFGPPLALACLLSLAGLSACNQQPAGQSAADLAASNSTAPLPSLPMATGPATAPAYAPSVAALPSARPLRVGRLEQPDDSYAYVDRAAGFSDTLGDAPPDYSFDYDGVSPWAWQASDRSMEFAEPVSGGYRYYYYEPGANTPYLVRDPYNSYAYSGGQLVMVYDAYGRALGDRAAYGRADYGSRYFARGEALRRVAFQNERRAVIAANWAARKGQIDASRAQWTEARVQDAGWQAYHDTHAARQQAHWQRERAQRQQAAAQFADWHRNDFRGPPSSQAAAAPQSGWQRVRSMFGGRPRQAARQQQSGLAIQQATVQRRQVPEQPQAAIPKQGPAFAAPQQKAADMRGAAGRGQQAQHQQTPQTAERDRSVVQQRIARQQVATEHMQLQARRTAQAQANAGHRQQEQAQRQQAQIQRRREPGMMQQRSQAMHRQPAALQRAQADKAHRQFVQPQRQRAQPSHQQEKVVQRPDHGRQQEGAYHQAAPKRQPGPASRPPMPAHPNPSQPSSHKGGGQDHKNHGHD